MLQKLISRAITRQEHILGVGLGYLREIARTSVSAFAKLMLIKPVSTHRRRLPLAAYHIARLATTKVEDCGECLQITVTLALQEGVDPGLVQAALHDRTDKLPIELANIFRFARTVAQGRDDAELRELLRDRYDDQGLQELAIAIATARVLPAVKRAMGHARSCAVYKVTTEPRKVGEFAGTEIDARMADVQRAGC